jgi:Ca-activated chloride channel family protein
MSVSIHHRTLTSSFAVAPRTTERVLSSLALLALSCSSDDEGQARSTAILAPAFEGTDAAGGSNVSFGGSQDMGFFRAQIEAGNVPSPESLDAAGFFAEHHTELPPPTCGDRLCLQPMLAVMGNLIDGTNCTLLQVALRSPIAADPTSRPPLDLSVVVDVSGSMDGQKIQFVRRGLATLLDGLDDDDRFALVTYSDGATTEVGKTEVAGRRVAIRETIETLVADGSTNLHAGLEAGFREVLAHHDLARTNRVILLSDGNPTAGITDASRIVDMSRAFNSEGIGLTTIGLGSDFNAELMRDLAQQADGNFYFLEDAGAVDEVFQEELSFFTVPIAFDLQLDVSAGPDHDFGRALGAPGWQDRGGGGRLELPSVFLAHRQSDDDVTEDGGRRGGGSSLLLELMPRAGAKLAAESLVATVDLRFVDPDTRLLKTESVDVKAPFSASHTPERGHFDAPDPAVIQKSFVMLNVYVGLERATLAFHRGNATSATLESLDALMAAVEDYNDEVGDVDVAADLDLLRRLRQNLVDGGIREPGRGSWGDPWPAD